jgi:ribose transport system permease protein
VIIIVLLTGIAIGCLNGILVARLRVHSLITTLGIGFAISGLTVGVSGGQTLFAGVPPVIPTLTNTSILGVKSSVWFDLAFAIAVYITLVHTPFGRRVYAVGGSERVARLAGVRTHGIKIAAFAIAGLFAALACLMQLGEAGAADPSFGINLLLPAFAAIFLGATTIRPGYFNVWGMIVAILAAGSRVLGSESESESERRTAMGRAGIRRRCPAGCGPLGTSRGAQPRPRHLA